MRLIDADLLKDNIKSWTEKIKGSRTDSQCFFTEENVLSAIDQCPDIQNTTERYYGYLLWEDDGIYCTCCRRKVYPKNYIKKVIRNYCPNCGVVIYGVERVK